MNYNTQASIINEKIKLDKTGLSDPCRSPRREMYCFQAYVLKNQSVEGWLKFEKKKTNKT